MNWGLDVWNSGPPPSCGWWIASVSYDKHVLRWWNGVHWSESVADTCSAFRASLYAEVPDYAKITHVQWMARPWHWPNKSKT